MISEQRKINSKLMNLLSKYAKLLPVMIKISILKIQKPSVLIDNYSEVEIIK